MSTRDYFLMDYTDGSNRNSPNSVWFLNNINGMDIDKKTVTLGFVGYNSLEDFQATPKKSPIGYKVYSLTPATWDAFFFVTGLNLAPLLNPCYDFSLLAKDVGEEPGEDAEGNPLPDTRVSFFETATKLSLDITP